MMGVCWAWVRFVAGLCMLAWPAVGVLVSGPPQLVNPSAHHVTVHP